MPESGDLNNDYFQKEHGRRKDSADAKAAQPERVKRVKVLPPKVMRIKDLKL